MNLNKEIGTLGENIASNFLIQKNFTIVTKNFRNRFGEIDIIGKKKDLLIFVEVKTRYNKSFGSPSSSVNLKKRKNIILLSKYFLNKYPSYNNFYISYDVIEIIFNSLDNSYKINHLENSFY